MVLRNSANELGCNQLASGLGLILHCRVPWYILRRSSLACAVAAKTSKMSATRVAIGNSMALLLLRQLLRSEGNGSRPIRGGERECFNNPGSKRQRGIYLSAQAQARK
jgi:hypothetical protein